MGKKNQANKFANSSLLEKSSERSSERSSAARLNEKIDAITLNRREFGERSSEKSSEKSSTVRLNERKPGERNSDTTKMQLVNKGAKTSTVNNSRKIMADHALKIVNTAKPEGNTQISHVKPDPVPLRISSSEPVGISSINISFQKSSSTKLSSRLQEILERRKTPLMNGTSKPFVNRSTLVSR